MSRAFDIIHSPNRLLYPLAHDQLERHCHLNINITKPQPPHLLLGIPHRDKNAMAMTSALRPGPHAMRLTNASRWHLSLDSGLMLSRNRISLVYASQWRSSSLRSFAQAQNPGRPLPTCATLRSCGKPDVDIRSLRPKVSFRKGIPFSTSTQLNEGNRYAMALPTPLRLGRFCFVSGVSPHPSHVTLITL